MSSITQRWLIPETVKTWCDLLFSPEGRGSWREQQGRQAPGLSCFSCQNITMRKSLIYLFLGRISGLVIKSPSLVGSQGAVF